MHLQSTGRAIVFVLATASGLACSSSSSTSDPPPPVVESVAVVPDSARVPPHGSYQFAASVTPEGAGGVTWSVDCGSVTQGGLFTAPDSDGVACHVEARSQLDTAKYGQATIDVSSAAASAWPAACAAEPLRTGGTTYYYCACGTGADAGCTPGAGNTGCTNPGAPCLGTWAQIVARFNSLSAGQTVALCKGGVWTGSAETIANTSCNPDPSCDTTGERLAGCVPSTTCDLRDYQGSWGGTSRPKIAYSGASDGIRVDGPSSIAANNGYRILNVALVHTPLTTPGVTALYLNNYATDNEFCNLELNGFYLGIYSEIPVGSCPTIRAAGGLSRNAFRGNRILNNSLDGALVDGFANEYDGNYFDNNGHDAADGYTHITNPNGGASHTFYLASECQAGNNRFVNNEIHRNAYRNSCVANEAVWNSTSGADTVIENNYIDMTPACGNNWIGAISFGSWSSGQGFNRPVVRRNVVVMNGGMGIDIRSSRQPLVEDNLFVVKNATAANGTGNVISVPDQNESSYGSSSDGVIRNNTIYLENSNVYTAAIAAGIGTGANYTVTGNTVTMVGSSGVDCFLFGSSADVAYMDHNHCSGTSRYVEAGSVYTLAGWQAATPWDDHSLTAAPQFTNPASNDFTLQPGSPLVNAGSTATSCTVLGVAAQACSSGIAIGGAPWAPTDAGKARDVTPDIGAFER